MVRSTPAPFTLHPNSQGRYPGSPLSETEDSDDGVCPIPIAVPKAAFVAKTDRSGGRAPKQNAAGSSGSRPERSRSPPEQGPSSRTGPQPQTASIIPGGDINPRVSALRHTYDSDREFEHLTGKHPSKFPSEAMVCNCWQIVGGKATSDPYLVGRLKKRQMKQCGCIIGSGNVHLCAMRWAL